MQKIAHIPAGRFVNKKQNNRYGMKSFHQWLESFQEPQFHTIYIVASPADGTMLYAGLNKSKAENIYRHSKADDITIVIGSQEFNSIALKTPRGLTKPHTAYVVMDMSGKVFFGPGDERQAQIYYDIAKKGAVKTVAGKREVLGAKTSGSVFIAKGIKDPRETDPNYEEWIQKYKNGE